MGVVCDVGLWEGGCGELVCGCGGGRCVRWWWGCDGCGVEDGCWGRDVGEGGVGGCVSDWGRWWWVERGVSGCGGCGWCVCRCGAWVWGVVGGWWWCGRVGGCVGCVGEGVVVMGWGVVVVGHGCDAVWCGGVMWEGEGCEGGDVGRCEMGLCGCGGWGRNGWGGVVVMWVGSSGGGWKGVGGGVVVDGECEGMVCGMEVGDEVKRESGAVVVEGGGVCVGRDGVLVDGEGVRLKGLCDGGIYREEGWCGGGEDGWNARGDVTMVGRGVILGVVSEEVVECGCRGERREGRRARVGWDVEGCWRMEVEVGHGEEEESEFRLGGIDAEGEGECRYRSGKVSEGMVIRGVEGLHVRAADEGRLESSGEQGCRVFQWTLDWREEQWKAEGEHVDLVLSYGDEDERSLAGKGSRGGAIVDNRIILVEISSVEVYDQSWRERDRDLMSQLWIWKVVESLQLSPFSLS
ncbi:hypothetical protein Tco_1103646 [Tanacetum coccineum]